MMTSGSKRNRSDDRPLWKKLRGNGARDARNLLARAKRRIARGEVQAALADYSEVLRTRPEDARLRVRVAELHVRSGEVALAVREYAEAAMGFARKGHERHAAALYTHALRLAPEDIEIRRRRAELYCQLGLQADGRAELMKIAEASRTSGNQVGLLDALHRLAELDPANTEIRIEVASILATRGQSEAALQQAGELLRGLEAGRNPAATASAAEGLCTGLGAIEPSQTAWLYAKCGAAHLECGATDAAVGILSRAIVMLPGEHSEAVILHELLIQAHEAAGDPAAVVESWESLVDLHRRRGDRELMRAVLQRPPGFLVLEAPPLTASDATGAVPQALTSTRRGDEDPNDSSYSRFEVDPMEPEHGLATHRDLAVGYLQMGAWHTAIETLSPLLASELYRREALGLLGVCHMGLDAPRDAIRALVEAVALAGTGAWETASLQFELAEAYLASGEDRRALQCFVEVAARHPGFRDVEDRVGELEEKLGA